MRNWLYTLNPYDKGSDHDVPLNSRFAIPSVFFFYWPHRYYHTDFDTPEKLDPQEFERSGTVAATLALVAASMRPALANSLLNLIHMEGVRAIRALAQDLDPATIVPFEQTTSSQQDRLWALAEREQGALRSVLNALPPAEQPELAPPWPVYKPL